MTPYEDSSAHLIDELRRIDLLLAEQVATWRSNESDGGGGLYVSDAEVDRLLGPDRQRHSGGDHALRERRERLAAEIRQRRAETLESGTLLRLPLLTERFGLSDREVDALLLAVAPELDLKYEKVYAYLHDDLTRKRPTVGLVLDVLTGTEHDRVTTRRLLAPDSTLARTGLVDLSAPDRDAPHLARRLTVDQRVVSFLLGRDGVDPALSETVDAVDPDARAGDLPVDEATRARVDRLAPSPDDDPVLRHVSGPYGAGKDAAVEAMCRGVVDAVVRTDAADLFGAGVADPLDRLVREARLRDGAVHVASVHELDRDGSDDVSGVGALARHLDGFDGHVFLTGDTEWTPPPDLDGHAAAGLHLPRPPYPRRKALWERRADRLPDGVEPADLAAAFRLTRGEIDDAIAAARTRADGAGLTAEALYRGCRAQSRRTLGALARETDPTYTWDDIVLPEAVKAELREVAAHVKHRGTVYADWGFADRFSLGNGMNVLFSGPSGTGKTMAAEIIANDAGLDMFKIDLASVVSKYIGETEENLKEIFDEAEHTDAILFFDEADALFGERSEVSDSQDRYANVEVSYLLQRMEEHDGAVVLTTNFKENIDDAFLRRINLNVDFPRPDYDSRVAIWETIFPEETPVGDLDVPFLASFEITGGNIKNVALTASFLAADDDGVVEMAHVVRALRRELQKTGRLVNPDEFGEYRDLVD